MLSKFEVSTPNNDLLFTPNCFTNNQQTYLDSIPHFYMPAKRKRFNCYFAQHFETWVLTIVNKDIGIRGLNLRGK